MPRYFSLALLLLSAVPALAQSGLVSLFLKFNTLRRKSLSFSGLPDKKTESVRAFLSLSGTISSLLSYLSSYG